MWDIIRYTPVWVWGLLAALVALGASQLRRRSVTRSRLLVLPAVLVTLGLWSTASSFAAPLAPLAVWAAGVVFAVMLGRRLPVPAGTAWDAATERLLLPGSVLPLLVIGIVFTLRYAGSVALVLHPAWRAAPEVSLPMAATYGLISGLLLGRALGLVALTRGAAATIAADGPTARA